MVNVVHDMPGIRQWCCQFMLSISLLTMPDMFVPAVSAQVPQFSDRIDCGMLSSKQIDEASGIAASRTNPGVLWTHNDSGDDARVFAIGVDGTLYAEYRLEGVNARDWEDIAVGPGPEDGVSYLYVGEIGDNSAIYPTKYIYRFPEPSVDTSRRSKKETVTGIDTISFMYPEHARDAETLMVDTVTRDIFVVSKREDAVNVYRAPYPHALNGTIMLDHVHTLPLTMTVGGDISADGTEILIKTYSSVCYWQRRDGESIVEALQRAPSTVPYSSEPQGEAICWAADGSGYFTLSEQSGSNPVHLYFFKRQAQQ